jgi:hypothetical protein
VTADALVELAELIRGGELAVDEQPGDLEVRRVLRDILDRIPAIAQDALLAIDVGDRTPGGGRVHEPLVEGRESRLLGERRDVHAVVTGGAAHDGEFGRSAGIGQRYELGVVGGVGHIYSLSAPQNHP